MPSSCGSPPRVRGQSARDLPEHRRRRFTPARAGTVTSRYLTSATRTVPPALRAGEISPAIPALLPVHPRACGDSGTLSLISSLRTGSPPRVRGQLEDRYCAQDHRRFTPARAGTVSVSIRRRALVPVHPRACGDSALGIALGIALAGSPPRVRGQWRFTHSEFQRARFTPARAGTVRIGDRTPRDSPVHPRACGDSSSGSSMISVNSGSPPRVRGQSMIIQLSG